MASLRTNQHRRDVLYPLQITYNALAKLGGQADSTVCLPLPWALPQPPCVAEWETRSRPRIPPQGDASQA